MESIEFELDVDQALVELEDETDDTGDGDSQFFDDKQHQNTDYGTGKRRSDHVVHSGVATVNNKKDKGSSEDDDVSSKTEKKNNGPIGLQPGIKSIQLTHDEDEDEKSSSRSSLMNHQPKDTKKSRTVEKDESEEEDDDIRKKGGEDKSDDGDSDVIQSDDEDVDGDVETEQLETEGDEMEDEEGFDGNNDGRIEILEEEDVDEDEEDDETLENEDEKDPPTDADMSDDAFHVGPDDGKTFDGLKENAKVTDRLIKDTKSDYHVGDDTQDDDDDDVDDENQQLTLDLTEEDDEGERIPRDEVQQDDEKRRQKAFAGDRRKDSKKELKFTQFNDGVYYVNLMRMSHVSHHQEEDKNNQLQKDQGDDDDKRIKDGKSDDDSGGDNKKWKKPSSLLFSFSSSDDESEKNDKKGSRFPQDENLSIKFQKREEKGVSKELQLKISREPTAPAATMHSSPAPMRGMSGGTMIPKPDLKRGGGGWGDKRDDEDDYEDEKRGDENETKTDSSVDDYDFKLHQDDDDDDYLHNFIFMNSSQKKDQMMMKRIKGIGISDEDNDEKRMGRGKNENESGQIKRNKDKPIGISLSHDDLTQRMMRISTDGDEYSDDHDNSNGAEGYKGLKDGKDDRDDEDKKKGDEEDPLKERDVMTKIGMGQRIIKSSLGKKGGEEELESEQKSSSSSRIIQMRSEKIMPSSSHSSDSSSSGSPILLLQPSTKSQKKIEVLHALTKEPSVPTSSSSRVPDSSSGTIVSSSSSVKKESEKGISSRRKEEEDDDDFSSRNKKKRTISDSKLRLESKEGNSNGDPDVDKSSSSSTSHDSLSTSEMFFEQNNNQHEDGSSASLRILRGKRGERLSLNFDSDEFDFDLLTSLDDPKSRKKRTSTSLFREDKDDVMAIGMKDFFAEFSSPFDTSTKTTPVQQLKMNSERGDRTSSSELNKQQSVSETNMSHEREVSTESNEKREFVEKRPKTSKAYQLKSKSPFFDSNSEDEEDENHDDEDADSKRGGVVLQDLDDAGKMHQEQNSGEKKNRRQDMKNERKSTTSSIIKDDVHSSHGKEESASGVFGGSSTRTSAYSYLQASTDRKSDDGVEKRRREEGVKIWREEKGESHDEETVLRTQNGEKRDQKEDDDMNISSRHDDENRPEKKMTEENKRGEETIVEKRDEYKKGNRREDEEEKVGGDGASGGRNRGGQLRWLQELQMNRNDGDPERSGTTASGTAGDMWKETGDENEIESGSTGDDEEDTRSSSSQIQQHVSKGAKEMRGKKHGPNEMFSDSKRIGSSSGEEASNKSSSGGEKGVAHPRILSQNKKEYSLKENKRKGGGDERNDEATFSGATFTECKQLESDDQDDDLFERKTEVDKTDSHVDTGSQDGEEKRKRYNYFSSPAEDTKRSSIRYMMREKQEVDSSSHDGMGAEVRGGSLEMRMLQHELSMDTTVDNFMSDDDDDHQEGRKRETRNTICSLREAMGDEDSIKEFQERKAIYQQKRGGGENENHPHDDEKTSSTTLPKDLMEASTRINNYHPNHPRHLKTGGSQRLISIRSLHLNFSTDDENGENETHDHHHQHDVHEDNETRAHENSTPDNQQNDERRGDPNEFLKKLHVDSSSSAKSHKILSSAHIISVDDEEDHHHSDGGDDSHDYHENRIQDSRGRLSFNKENVTGSHDHQDEIRSGTECLTGGNTKFPASAAAAAEEVISGSNSNNSSSHIIITSGSIKSHHDEESVDQQNVLQSVNIATQPMLSPKRTPLIRDEADPNEKQNSSSSMRIGRDGMKDMRKGDDHLEHQQEIKSGRREDVEIKWKVKSIQDKLEFLESKVQALDQKLTFSTSSGLIDSRLPHAANQPQGLLGEGVTHHRSSSQLEFASSSDPDHHHPVRNKLYPVLPAESTSSELFSPASSSSIIMNKSHKSWMIVGGEDENHTDDYDGTGTSSSFLNEKSGFSLYDPHDMKKRMMGQGIKRGESFTIFRHEKNDDIKRADDRQIIDDRKDDSDLKGMMIHDEDGASSPDKIFFQHPEMTSSFLMPHHKLRENEMRLNQMRKYLLGKDTDDDVDHNVPVEESGIRREQIWQRMNEHEKRTKDNIDRLSCESKSNFCLMLRELNQINSSHRMIDEKTTQLNIDLESLYTQVAKDREILSQFIRKQDHKTIRKKDGLKTQIDQMRISFKSDLDIFRQEIQNKIDNYLVGQHQIIRKKINKLNQQTLRYSYSDFHLNTSTHDHYLIPNDPDDRRRMKRSVKDDEVISQVKKDLIRVKRKQDNFNQQVSSMINDIRICKDEILKIIDKKKISHDGDDDDDVHVAYDDDHVDDVHHSLRYSKEEDAPFHPSYPFEKSSERNIISSSHHSTKGSSTLKKSSKIPVPSSASLTSSLLTTGMVGGDETQDSKEKISRKSRKQITDEHQENRDDGKNSVAKIDEDHDAADGDKKRKTSHDDDISDDRGEHHDEDRVQKKKSFLTTKRVVTQKSSFGEEKVERDPEKMRTPEKSMEKKIKSHLVVDDENHDEFDADEDMRRISLVEMKLEKICKSLAEIRIINHQNRIFPSQDLDYSLLNYSSDHQMRKKRDARRKREIIN